MNAPPAIELLNVLVRGRKPEQGAVGVVVEHQPVAIQHGD